MESRRITAGAIAASVALVFILFSSVLGCLRDELGDCRAPKPYLRIGVIGGEKGNAMLILETKIRTLQADLLEFVDGTANSSWRARGLMEFTRVPQNHAVQIQHLRPVFALSMMPDSSLMNAETDLLLRDAPANLIQVRRLTAITNEIARRDQERLTARIRRLNALALAKPAAVPQHIPAPVIPGSSDPYNAPAPSGQAVYIAPLSSVWYNVSDRGRRLTMWMDANKQSGLVMAIYGADQQDVWNAKPVGTAAAGEGHDFFWTGRSRFKGIWRVRITNTNDFAVPYTLTATAVSDKNGDLCRDCHGVIEDEWDRCEHDGSFCEDLKDQYAN